MTLGEGDTIAIGAYVLAILSPGPRERVSTKTNDTSLVIMFVAPHLKALYTGDIGFEVEERLVRQYNLDADILKVPHHGSKYSSGEGFLAAVSPLFSVIGVGRNSYGHPTPAALSRISAVASQIFRTDTEGVLKIPLTTESLTIFKKIE
jgi:competence protein ComEC